MSEDGTFEFESVEDEKSIQAFLAALAEGFGKGRVALESQGLRIELTPGTLMSFSVKARRKDGESRMAIRVSWRDARRQPGQGAHALKVES